MSRCQAHPAHRQGWRPRSPPQNELRLRRHIEQRRTLSSTPELCEAGSARGRELGLQGRLHRLSSESEPSENPSSLKPNSPRSGPACRPTCPTPCRESGAPPPPPHMQLSSTHAPLIAAAAQELLFCGNRRQLGLTLVTNSYAIQVASEMWSNQLRKPTGRDRATASTSTKQVASATRKPLKVGSPARHKRACTMTFGKPRAGGRKGATRTRPSMSASHG